MSSDNPPEAADERMADFQPQGGGNALLGPINGVFQGSQFFLAKLWGKIRMD